MKMNRVEGYMISFQCCIVLACLTMIASAQISGSGNATTADESSLKPGIVTTSSQSSVAPASSATTSSTTLNTTVSSTTSSPSSTSSSSTSTSTSTSSSLPSSSTTSAPTTGSSTIASTASASSTTTATQGTISTQITSKSQSTTASSQNINTTTTAIASTSKLSSLTSLPTATTLPTSTLMISKSDPAAATTSTTVISTTAATTTTLATSTNESTAVVTETAATKPPTGSSSKAWKIAVGVIVPVVVLAIIAVIVALILCPCCRNKDKKKPHDSWTSARIPSLANSKPIPVSQFQQHVITLEKDSGLLYAAEFEELKSVGRHQPHDIASQQKNREKNRFANIQPYDVALVKLKPMNGDEEEADYINASWLPGYRSKREYISTQGPMPNTRDDFWRMIWEYECRGVVMLANCMENGMIKCDYYWPRDHEAMNYGDLTVTVTNEKLTDQWDVRDMQLAMGTRVHHIKHFHYHVWDDMIVPKNPDSILHFIQVVREEVNSIENSSNTMSGMKPLVVHCSAGVGRSGTFIALDTLLRQLNETNVVDVYGVVYKLRMNRINMVQTEMQYIFLHKCLAHVIQTMKARDNPAYVKDSADESPNGTSSVTSFNGPPSRLNGKVPPVFGVAPPVTTSSNVIYRNSPGIRTFPQPPPRQGSPSIHSDPSRMTSYPGGSSSYYDVSLDGQSIGLINLAPPTPNSTSPVPSPRQRNHVQSRDMSVGSVYITPTPSPYNSNILIESL